MMRPLVALALSMMVLESKGLMVNGSITRMLILSELDLMTADVRQLFWLPYERLEAFVFTFLLRTFFELFGSSKSFMESHSRSHNGHMVIVSLVDNLTRKGIYLI